MVSRRRQPLRWRVLAAFYALVRPLVVRRLDANEDFECVQCGKPVLRRFLTCSRACGDAFDVAMELGE